ncbi:conserved hypothetical protein [Neospora caninum Liverpool]|uniref:Uncharacterized protein n=1 Tax=Neospora caninum (strain Liverpool) TaxID=572307 RepID=F0VIN8_NEOCL|nr:conserved hypothetical protein [Neospora caninum Liverpool]CBZ53599.1 conserved hypothetical protein [Neospora caninum Liverpool]CEL67589.1 TPA: hypothetical protein BN1204_033860 [Neospora caninum Liverpool]|eukprot:XP_003883631.1 conserved hypothetical protein [Neospora caninum Liverpool]
MDCSNQLSSSVMMRLRASRPSCVSFGRLSYVARATGDRSALPGGKARLSFVSVAAVFLLCLDGRQSPIIPAECVLSVQRLPGGHLPMEPTNPGAVYVAKRSNMALKPGRMENIRRTQVIGRADQFTRSRNGASDYLSLLELSAKQKQKKDDDDEGSEDTGDDEEEQAGSAKEGGDSEKEERDSEAEGKGSRKEESAGGGESSEDGAGHHASSTTEERAGKEHTHGEKPETGDASEESKKPTESHHEAGEKQSSQPADDFEPDEDGTGDKYKVQFNFEPELLIPSDLRAKVKQRKVVADGVQWFQVGTEEPTKLLKVEGATGKDKFLHHVHVANSH